MVVTKARLNLSKLSQWWKKKCSRNVTIYHSKIAINLINDIYETDPECCYGLLHFESDLDLTTKVNTIYRP